MSKVTGNSKNYIQKIILTFSDCMTVSGPNPDEPCIFPFKYDSKTFKTCTVYDNVGGNAWCATKVDGSGNHFYGDYQGDYYYDYDQENWGNCGPNCPIPG